MYQSDYILRVIEQLGTLVKRMLDAIAEARPEDVSELSEEALGLALDLDPDVALALTGEGLLTFMGTSGDIDPGQALIVGQVLVCRAQASVSRNEIEAGASEARRARVVLAAVAACADLNQASEAERLLRVLDELA